MQIKEKSHGEIILLVLKGDLLSEPDQKKLMEKVRDLAGAGTKHVIIDMSSVHFINSCGLGSLVCALTTLRKAGGDLRLAGIGSTIKNLFVITQLERVFDFYPTTEKAVAGYLKIQKKGPK